MFRLFGLDLRTPLVCTFYIITVSFFMLIFVVMTKFCNQTVGKMIFGIRVISNESSKLKWSTVLFREWIGRLFLSFN